MPNSEFVTPKKILVRGIRIAESTSSPLTKNVGVVDVPGSILLEQSADEFPKDKAAAFWSEKF